jgi:hypothetical protein
VPRHSQRDADLALAVAAALDQIAAALRQWAEGDDSTPTSPASSETRASRSDARPVTGTPASVVVPSVSPPQSYSTSSCLSADVARSCIRSRHRPSHFRTRHGG